MHVFRALVGRFGTFVRESYVAVVVDEPASPFPDELNHMRHAIAHHLIGRWLHAGSNAHA